MEGDQLPSGWTFAVLCPGRQPHRGNDGPDGAGDAEDRPVHHQVNKALVYLVKSKDSYGTWGSTQATILALKALIAGMGGSAHKGTVEFTILVNGKEAARGKVTEDNADVMQLFDLKEQTQRSGVHQVTIEVKGETNLMYQVVARHFEPWGEKKVEQAAAGNGGGLRPDEADHGRPAQGEGDPEVQRQGADLAW